MTRTDRSMDLRRLPEVALRTLAAAGRVVVCAGAAEPLSLLAAASLADEKTPERPRRMRPATLSELAFPLPYSPAL